LPTTTYSYSQILTGFSGYFDITSNPLLRCMQKNSVLMLAITGTDASIKCDGGATEPFVITVDGSAPVVGTVTAGSMPLFAGLADTRHIISLVPNNGYTPTSNWFTIAETQILSVTGAAPAMTPIPMDFATWTTFPGLSTTFTMAAYGGNVTPTTELQASDDDFSVGVITFYASCDSIYVFSGNGNLRYSIDGGAIQTVVVSAATTERHLVTLATGLNTALHRYTIWQDTDGSSSKPQAVACMLAGAKANISSPGSVKKIFQYGDSITEGQGGTAGGVDIFQVGLDVNCAPAKWGVGGLTISGLTANIPGYFLRSKIPDFALLAIGRNDIGSPTIQADYTACIQALLNAGCTKIVCRGVLREGAQVWGPANADIQAAVASFSSSNIVFMDTSTWAGIVTSDGVHPTNAGYVTIAGYETPVLQAIIAAWTPAVSSGWCPGFYPGWGQ
jgi:lysophospholipase L1-like esterase